MSRQGRLARGVLVASVLLLAACGASTGGGGSAPSTPANPGGPAGSASGAPQRIACELLSNADAQAALGKPVGAPSTTGNPHSCSYRGTDGQGLLTLNTISTRHVAEIVAQNVSGAPVSGLGDEAFYAGGARELVVVKGDSGFSIVLAVSALDPNQTLAKAKELAQKVLAKL